MSSQIEGLRVRAQRLMRGDFRVDDLAKLFLFVRDRCDGRESVKEIGDFVAHHNERQKGIVTRSVRDLFLFMRLRFPDLDRKISSKRLPPFFSDFIDANTRLIDNKTFKLRTGMSKARVMEMIPGIKEKIQANADGTLRIESVTFAEKEILQCLTRTFSVQPAFTGDQLFQDFRATLLKRSILRPQEAKQFKTVAPMVLLFATAEMHNSILVLDDASRALLHLQEGSGATNHMIEIASRSPDVAGTRWITPVFSTELSVDRYCEPALLDLLRSRGDDMDCNIEVTESCRLGLLI